MTASREPARGASSMRRTLLPRAGLQSEYHVFTDGASRGNPGHAGLGVIVEEAGGATLVEWSEYLGQCTNNVAEYRALLAAFDQLAALPPKPTVFHLDSELVVKHLNGEYRVKDAKLKVLYDDVRRRLVAIPGATFVHIPREQNARADRLANEAIDRAIKSTV